MTHIFNTNSIIIYLDDSIVVINKPPGLLSIQDGYHPELPFAKKILEEQFGRVWVVHRLDRETSGLMIFARNAEAHRRLNDQFEHRKVHKCYHALIRGVPSWDELTIDLKLHINGDRRHRTVIDDIRGKPASTSISVLSRFTINSLVEAKPNTGYTHQIRCHLCAVGYPILGDSLYTLKDQHTPPESLFIQRTALHAYSAVFSHPISNSEMSLIAPYPQDFMDALKALS
jgi:tRNA pseudouridine32 synthase / 23S rRNA pseudouridine746 synthase